MGSGNKSYTFGSNIADVSLSLAVPKAEDGGVKWAKERIRRALAPAAFAAVSGGGYPRGKNRC